MCSRECASSRRFSPLGPDTVCAPLELLADSSARSKDVHEDNTDLQKLSAGAQGGLPKSDLLASFASLARLHAISVLNAARHDVTAHDTAHDPLDH